ncbi:MAG TPA: C40 family peptidase [Pontibacter sp.]
MKKNFLLILSPLLLLAVLLFSDYRFYSQDAGSPANSTAVEPSEQSVTDADWVSMGTPREHAGNYSSGSEAQDLIAYAFTLMGTPYQYAGTSPDGFDCSGFVTHVFESQHIAVPHSSALQADEGVAVAKTEAAPGDLVIFTGTNEAVREPGHVGIVISEPGDTIRFIHSSSNGGVKISQVQGTRYDVRFLEVRRVL